MPQALPKTGLPDDLTKQLTANETLYFFSPVVFKGGCLGLGGGGNFWAAMTDKRFLYHAKVQEGTSYVEREGTLQLKNISQIEIVEVKPEGCLSQKFWQLNVNAQGVVVALPFPSKEKGIELRTLHHELSNM